MTSSHVICSGRQCSSRVSIFFTESRLQPFKERRHIRCLFEVKHVILILFRRRPRFTAFNEQKSTLTCCVAYFVPIVECCALVSLVTVFPLGWPRGLGGGGEWGSSKDNGVRGLGWLTRHHHVVRRSPRVVLPLRCTTRNGGGRWLETDYNFELIHGCAQNFTCLWGIHLTIGMAVAFWLVGWLVVGCLPPAALLVSSCCGF